MHVRFSTVVGLPIIEDGSEEEIAYLSHILIHPDQGKVEGFFVRIPGFFKAEELFLSAMDIAHWGTVIRVRDAAVFSSLEDLIRLQSLYEEQRPVLNQTIVSEAGRLMGTCRDVQFDTGQFMLEWIFPRKWFRWATPLPASSIVQVRTDSIVVKDMAPVLQQVVTVPSVQEMLDPLTSTASRVVQRRKQT